MPTQRKKPGVFSRAFWNQYNLILLAGAGLFAAATFSWLPLLVGAGVETLWMVLGADSDFFRRWVARQESKERQAELAEKAAQALASLNPRYVETFDELKALADKIEQLARDNPSLGTQLVQGEMDKLGVLLQSYLDMAVLHQRYSDYLDENSDRDIMRDNEKNERALAHEDSPEVQASLRQSLELGEKRLKQHQRIEANYRLLGVKMDTLEKSFRYLESHIISIGKGEDLSAELDGLILGVDSVEELGRETEGLLPSSSASSAPQRRPQPQAIRR